jgi:predicted MFS family arabinose efflux permease
MRAEDVPVEKDRAPHRAVLPVILLAQFVIPLSIAGTAVGLPSISTELGTAPVLLQGIVNGFNIAFALSTVVWGAIADRIGSTRAFSIGGALVVVGSLVSATSPTLLMLDLVRVIAGIGAAAVITGATATISGSFSGTARARAFAAFGTINGLGLAAGPSVSGALIGLLGWRAVFLVQAALIAVALVGSLLLPNRTAIDGAHRAHDAAFDLVLLRNPGFLAMLLIPVAGAVGFVTLLTYLPAAIQAVHGLTSRDAGVLMLCMTIPVLAAPTVVHRVTARHPRIGTAAVSLTALACLLIAPLGLLWLRPDTPIGMIVIPMVLAGLGFGLPLGVVDGRALSFVPARRSGSAAGLLNFFRIGSEAAFVALYGMALTASIRHQPSAAAAADQIAAGQPGHPWAYAHALPPLLLGISVVVLALGIAFSTLYRRATRTLASRR